MIIGDGIMLGASGETASIFVTGVAQTDTVTCTKNGKSYKGEWKSKSIIIPNVPLIPNMTSNTAPSGVASATKVYSNNLAYRAFDGDDSTYAYGSVNALPWTLQYEFPQSVSINSFSYRIGTASSTDGERTATHNVQVSLDGSTWETIWSGQTSRGGNNPESGAVTLTETKNIKYIKWVTTAMTGGENPSECVYDFQVYRSQEDVVEGYEFTVNDYGTYTITATNGTNTTTQDVLVDSAAQYDISLSYVDERLKIWLNGSGYTDESYVGNEVKNYGTELVITGDFPYYAFDGSSHYIQFPSQTIDPNDFAISLWAYFDSFYAYERLFDFGEGNASDFWCGHTSSSGVIVFGYQISGTGYRSSSVTLASGAWHHVAIKGENGVTTLYVDGVSVASMSISSSELSLANCYLGKSNWNDPYLHGRIADFRLYNTAITEAEIIELYQSGAYVPN